MGRDELARTFVSSDQHFSHANIIEFCKRPFDNVDAMNLAMIDGWNKTVTDPQAYVFHLGDFTLEGHDVAYGLFEQLRGMIYVTELSWHHDKRWLPGIKRGPGYQGLDGIQVTGWPGLVVIEASGFGERPLSITLCHYPMVEWDRKMYGGIMLHGHTHGTFKSPGRIYDVGVDANNFCPVNLLDLVERLLEVAA